MIHTTLGRYFFQRYAAITLWFLAGIFALVFIVNTALSALYTVIVPAVGEFR